MNTYLFFYTDPDQQKLQKIEISKYFCSIYLDDKNILSVNAGEETENALIKCLEIQKNLSFMVHNPILRIVLYSSESKPERQFLIKNLKLMIDFESHISLNHISFAQLLTHSNFDFRFLGLFPGEKMNETISLFDFITNVPGVVTSQKIDSKSVFEDSVINFYNNRVSQAIAGFYNVLKLCPEDRASMKYIEKSKEILSLK